jgi:hypothetical protein
MMRAPDKSKDERAFRTQARRAGRAVLWILRVLFAVFIGLVLCMSGLVLTHYLLPWIGIPLSVLGVFIFCYGLWWAVAGRFRCLTCPVCGVRGRISKDEWAYLFHCPQCGRTADTGVGVPRIGEAPPW